MRQAFLGSRALLYFDGRADAGLSRSIIVGVIGLGIGLLFGAVVTWFYDRKGIHRIEAATQPAAPAQSAAADTDDGSNSAASRPQATQHVSTSTES